MSKLIVTQTWTGGGIPNYPVDAGELTSVVYAVCFQATEPPTQYSNAFYGQFPDDWVLEFPDSQKVACALRQETADSNVSTEVTPACRPGLTVNLEEDTVVMCDFVSNVEGNISEVPTLGSVGMAVMISMVLAVGLLAIKKIAG